MKPFAATLLGLALTSALPATAQVPAAPGHLNDGVAHMGRKVIPASHAVNVTFAGHTLTLTLTDLQALPQTTVHVHNAHSDADEVYSGPLLADVLARAGLHAGKDTEPTILHSTTTATGTDGYFVLYAATEAEPAFSHGQVIVALTRGGQPDSDGGSIQLINTTDAKPARWVHGLASLNVITLGGNHAVMAM